MEHVLSEIKVLDLTASLPGAFCTMNLGDCGAQVVKVELPGGDPNRTRGPLKNGASAFFAGLNRNKKSLCLDYTKPEGRDLLLKLVASCDVVVTDDPSVLDYGAAKAANPGVIYAAITGFGESGPLKDHLADDLILTAMSGMMDRTGRRGEPPMMPGVNFGGTYSGLALLSGIVMALFHKLTSGEGTKIEVSVLDCIFYMLELFVMNYSIDGRIVPKNGNQDTEVAPLGTFAAQDGYAAVAISSEGQWKKFCALVGADQLVDDPRFADNASRLANLEELIPEIGKITGAWKKDELVAAMGASKLAGGALKSVEEMVHDPQIRAAEMIVAGQDPVLGPLYRVGTPMKLGATPLDVTAMPAPALGQHTEEILRAVGVSGPKIAELTQTGVISQHTFSIRSANQNMKAIVCVKQVPDTSGKVAVNPDGTLNRASMQTITNPDDMNAVEAALRLKDETGCKVVVVTMGPPPAEGMLRELLAMGADEAVLVSAREFGGSDTYATSQILSAAIKKIGLDKDDVIFCGRQAIDGDTAQVGPQIAEKLGIPQVSYAAEITKEGKTLTIKRMLEDGYMTIKVNTPCLITCIKELNTPRYMSVGGIFECYEKPYEVLDYNALKDDPLIDPATIGLKGSPTNILTSFTPPQKGAGMMLEGADKETCEKLAGILAAKHLI